MRYDILQVIKMWKLQKPSFYSAEIRTWLLLKFICTLDDLPSIDVINKSVRRKIGITRKYISSIPLEYTCNMGKVDENLKITSRINPSTIHFFDVASEVKTNSNSNNIRYFK